MSLARDLKVLYQLTLNPIRGVDHKERLESFYSGQAELYDSFRQRLLPGREELVRNLAFKPGQVWVDMGGGTGSNLDFLKDEIPKLEKYIIVDLSPSLLEQAAKKVKTYGLNNVELIEHDACSFAPEKRVDGYIFSYSLTMIPDWFAAVDQAYKNLAPNGVIAVVDFFVSRKYPELTGQQSWWTRNFWPLWFSNDNVYLSSEHIPYLYKFFTPERFSESRTRLPYLPFVNVPYYQFIGHKKQ